MTYSNFSNLILYILYFVFCTYPCTKRKRKNTLLNALTSGINELICEEFHFPIESISHAGRHDITQTNKPLNHDGWGLSKLLSGGGLELHNTDKL